MIICITGRLPNLLAMESGMKDPYEFVSSAKRLRDDVCMGILETPELSKRDPKPDHVSR